MSRRLLDLITFREIQSRYRNVAVVMTMALLLSACSQIRTGAELPSAATAELIPVIEEQAPPLDPPAAPLPLPTQTRGPLPTKEAAVLASSSSVSDLAIDVEDIQLFPVPKIISGDLVTFHIQPDVPGEVSVENVPIVIYVDGQPISSGTLDWRNWEGKAQGTYEWVWNTTGTSGWHEVRVVLDEEDLIREGDDDSENNAATLSVRVGKIGERPLEERDARWISAEADCCTVHALTRTAAYRDLPELLSLVDSAVSEAASRLNTTPEEKLDIYFVERTIAQGGYTGSEMVIVYNDRPYIGGDLYDLLVHESVHILDRQFAPQRIEFLAEGVAVWTAGGHYWDQDLQRRTAALLKSNAYIPLAELANNLYPSQHETAYLEAGAFVDYLVAQYSWQEVREFYSNTSNADGSTDAEALDVNLRRYFNMSLAEMEANWLAELMALPLSDIEIADIQTSIRYFETARAYQKKHDPTAYFRSAWLPHPAQVVEKGNVADFLRQPDSETNFAVELMLRSAYEAIRSQDFGRANVLLTSIERFLSLEGSTIDPLTASYRDIVRTVVAFGYEPHRIVLDGSEADVLATTASGNQLFNLNLGLQRGDWILDPG